MRKFCFVNSHNFKTLQFPAIREMFMRACMGIVKATTLGTRPSIKERKMRRKNENHFSSFIYFF